MKTIEIVLINDLGENLDGFLGKSGISDLKDFSGFRFTEMKVEAGATVYLYITDGRSPEKKTVLMNQIFPMSAFALILSNGPGESLLKFLEYYIRHYETPLFLVNVSQASLTPDSRFLSRLLLEEKIEVIQLAGNEADPLRKVLYLCAQKVLADYREKI